MAKVTWQTVSEPSDPLFKGRWVLSSHIRPSTLVQRASSPLERVSGAPEAYYKLQKQLGRLSLRDHSLKRSAALSEGFKVWFVYAGGMIIMPTLLIQSLHRAGVGLTIPTSQERFEIWPASQDSTLLR